MFSRFELFLPIKESILLENLFKEIVEVINQLENQISKYIDGSETSRLNKNAAIYPVKVSDEFFNLLKQCLEYKQKTGGYFNICAGSAVQVDKIGINLDEKNKRFIFIRQVCGLTPVLSEKDWPCR